MLNDLKSRPSIDNNPKLLNAYKKLDQLLQELSKKELTDELTQSINHHIDELNQVPDSGSSLKAELRKRQAKVIQVAEKKMKIVPKSHYRNMWLAIGMAAFGIPMGTAFGVALGNMAFIAIGFPIGMGLGIAVGTNMDRKAEKEGRQLDFEA